MTAVCCVNKQGSTQSPQCNQITREIWLFAIERNMWIHLPGTLNTEADLASRQFKDETEWTLRDDIFQYVSRRLFIPDIDLFASRLNHKVPVYAAWNPDPGATIINSLMHYWGDFSCIYAFPPFAIIHMVLQKLIMDQAEGILIVPFWTTKPWFTQFADMICKRPILIDVIDDVLFLPFDRSSARRPHPMAGKLQLIAARCSGTSSKPRAFRNELSTPSLRLDDSHRTSYITRTSDFGKTIVSKGTLIPLHHMWLNH
jgi:hypothetical protein